MNPISVVMIGASGAVGGAVVRCLQTMPEVNRITLLNRRPLDLSGDKINQHVIDPGAPESFRGLLTGHDVAICTLGVGEPSKASREEFLRIDHDMPLAFATECRAAGIDGFSLLSAVGSNPGSRIFYIRTKGALEDSLRALRFARLSLAHPSMILTPQNRYGVTQAVALAIWPWLDPLLAGPLRKYRGIKVGDLGTAIARDAVQPGPGERVLEWDAFTALAGR